MSKLSNKSTFRPIVLGAISGVCGTVAMDGSLVQTVPRRGRKGRCRYVGVRQLGYRLGQRVGTWESRRKALGPCEAPTGP